MKSKVINLLIKYGNNEQDVLEMVEQNLEIAVKSYPDARPAFIAEIINSLR